MNHWVVFRRVGVDIRSRSYGIFFLPLDASLAARRGCWANSHPFTPQIAAIAGKPFTTKAKRMLRSNASSSEGSSRLRCVEVFFGACPISRPMVVASKRGCATSEPMSWATMRHAAPRRAYEVRTGNLMKAAPPVLPDTGDEDGFAACKPLRFHVLQSTDSSVPRPEPAASESLVPAESARLRVVIVLRCPPSITPRSGSNHCATQ